ncbi:MAG: hypothetical protein ABSA46_06025 [Thermodesulfovibrionales bacterium]|jgi:hypothetical protein
MGIEIAILHDGGWFFVTHRDKVGLRGMTDKEIIRILIVNPIFFSVPLLERLKVIKFMKECHFAPREIEDIFVQACY